MRKAKSARSSHRARATNHVAAWHRGVNVELVRRMEAALADAAAHGIQAHVSSARRTHRQQVALYRRYLAGLNPYPVAPPGHSNHERGLAIDVWAGSTAATTAFAGIAARHGLHRPLGMRDEVHFEMA